MYAVIVRIRLKPGCEAAFLHACEDNHRGSRQEPGNRRWEVLRVLGATDRFILDELYADEAAFTAHQQTAHYLRWKEAVAPLMAEPRSADKAERLLPVAPG